MSILLHPLKKIKSLGDRPWFVPFVSLLSALDAFVIFVPNEVLLVTAVVGRPKKWLSTSVFVSLGSAIGAVAFAQATHIWGPPLIEKVFPHLLESSNWMKTADFLRNHSVWGLVAVSLSPFPQHAAIAVAGLANISLLNVFLSVLSARSVKYGIVAWAAHQSHRVVS